MRFASCPSLPSRARHLGSIEQRVNKINWTEVSKELDDQGYAVIEHLLAADLYGEHVFPLQQAILLSEPLTDFTGGEFVLTEQRPRMQSRPMVVPLRKGDAVVFAVQSWPVQGKRGIFRVNLRHGVSKLLSGHRQCLGIIFHDAQ